MNQFGFIELTIMKNDLPYRVLLPMGTPWKDAQDALIEITQNIAEHIKLAEAAQAEKADKDQQDAEQKGN